MFPWFFFFFFFKQKTAYEMLRSLVGSEMCIRDRVAGDDRGNRKQSCERGVKRPVHVERACCEGIRLRIDEVDDARAHQMSSDMAPAMQVIYHRIRTGNKQGTNEADSRVVGQFGFK